MCTTLKGTDHNDMHVLVSETAVTAEGRGAENLHNFIYRVSQEECDRLRENVPYVKIHRYNPKTPISKVERLRR